jgi:multiple sugar transport system permease protein
MDRLAKSKSLHGLGRIFTYGIVWGGALTMIIPFLWMIAISLEAKANIQLPYPPRLVPAHFSFINYHLALSSVPFGRYFINSVFVGVTVTLLQLLVASMAAYAFAMGRFPGQKVLFVFVLVTMMIPMQVTVIPLFDLMFKFKMVNTYGGLIFPAIYSAFGTFFLVQFMETIPREIVEAAHIDGWGHWLIYRALILPLSKPALVTLAMLSFIGSWNSFMWPLIVTTNNLLYTIPLGLMNFRQQYSAQWGSLMAGATLAVLPVIVIFILAQKHIIQGIAITGMK